MKIVLGSLLALWLFGAQYSITPSKNEAYLKEPILLRLQLKEPLKRRVVWVRFEPKPNPAYQIHLLEKKDLSDGYENRYLLFPLKSGRIDVDFVLQIKRTSEEEIQKDILGTGYEQTKIIEGVIETIQVPPLQLHIKPAKATLYGSYTLSLHVDPTKVKSYEPVYATLRLQGLGYPIEHNLTLKTDPKIKILADRPEISIHYTSQGAKSSYVRRFALIGDRNFTILPIKIEAFDYQHHYTLTTKPTPITITPWTGLTDHTDDPAPIEPVAKRLLELLRQLAIFAAGFISALVMVIFLRRRYERLWRILMADERELLAFLSMRYPDRYKQIKKRLSEAITQGKRVNLFKIKLQILKARS